MSSAHFSSRDGRIQTIEEDHFTVSADKRSAPTKIAYTEVTQVKGKLTPGAKIGLVGGMAGLALAILIPIGILLTRD